LQDGGQGTSQGTYADSLLLIEGVETQGLFNWLLNSKLCLSSTGPLTGIPPTLFSPVAFHQATLRPLKVTECQSISKSTISQYCFSTQGPTRFSEARRRKSLLHRSSGSDPTPLDGIANETAAKQRFHGCLDSAIQHQAFRIIPKFDRRHFCIW
jgi:hypothetical protein